MSTDPPRRKVAAQIPITSTPTPASQPRARAKVDPSSLSTPTQSRPPLRASVSSTSLVSRVSASRSYSPATPSAAVRRATTDDAGPAPGTPGTPGTPSTAMRSPAPPHMPPRSMSTPGHSVTPTIRARATPTQTNRPSTPVTLPKVPGVKVATTTAAQSAERTRARVKMPPSGLGTPTAQSQNRPALPTPSLSGSARSVAMQPSSSAGPSLVRRTSLQSSPGKKASALPAYLQQHVQPLANASAPPSPPLGHSASAVSSNRMLPLNPGNAPFGFYANLPTSPEVRTIDLPLMTPRRGSEASESSSRSRSNSALGSALSVSGRPSIDTSRNGSSELGRGIRLNLHPRDNEEGDRWSGTTAVDSIGGDAREKLPKGDTPDIDLTSETPEEDEVEAEILGDDEDAEEAKVNRKVADLEISNASLMAINRSLEATKAKQRTEIIKLRRALRESRDAPSLHLAAAHTFAKPLPSPLNLQSPTTENFDAQYADYLSDEMDDPELEDRWEKIQDMVLTMQRKGEGAVKKGFEEERLLTRVLDWTEVEGEAGSGLGTPMKGSTEGLTPGRGSPTEGYGGRV